MLVAEKLGKTLSELQEAMTVEELQLWNAFYILRQQEEKKAMEGVGRRR